MRFIDFKKVMIVLAFGLMTFLGTSGIINAQNDRDRDNQRRERRDDDRQQPNRHRWRVYHDGRYYETDNRGVELLKQAVRRGYQIGFREGRRNRDRNYRADYYDSDSYRNGSYGYRNYVDSGEYRYYFQQGFQRGYEDGFNSRYQYGRYRNGVANILGNVLANILNLRQY